LFHLGGWAEIDIPICVGCQGSALRTTLADVHPFDIAVVSTDESNADIKAVVLANNTFSLFWMTLRPDFFAIQKDLFGFAFGTNDLNNTFVTVDPSFKGIIFAVTAENGVNLQGRFLGVFMKPFGYVVRGIASPVFWVLSIICIFSCKRFSDGKEQKPLGDYSSTATRSPFPHKGRLYVICFSFSHTPKAVENLLGVDQRRVSV
jgi:hypothetical protein